MFALVVVAAVVALAAVGFSVRPLRALSQADGRHLTQLGALPRTPTASGMLARLERMPEGDLRRAIDAVLRADTAHQAVYAVTEISLSAQSEVRRVGYLPRVAGRVAMATGTLLALVILSQTLPSGQAAVREAGLSFVFGVAGAAGCAWVGHRLDLLIEQRRQAWTSLLDALGQIAEGAHLPTAENGRENPGVDLLAEAD